MFDYFGDIFVLKICISPYRIIYFHALIVPKVSYPVSGLSGLCELAVVFSRDFCRKCVWGIIVNICE